MNDSHYTYLWLLQISIHVISVMLAFYASTPKIDQIVTVIVKWRCGHVLFLNNLTNYVFSAGENISHYRKGGWVIFFTIGKWILLSIEAESKSSSMFYFIQSNAMFSRSGFVV